MGVWIYIISVKCASVYKCTCNMHTMLAHTLAWSCTFKKFIHLIFVPKYSFTDHPANVQILLSLDLNHNRLEDYR